MTDYKREEIIEKLNHLKQRSKDFADEIKTKRELAEQSREKDEETIRKKFKEALKT